MQLHNVYIVYLLSQSCKCVVTTVFIVIFWKHLFTWAVVNVALLFWRRRAPLPVTPCPSPCGLTQLVLATWILRRFLWEQLEIRQRGRTCCTWELELHCKKHGLHSNNAPRLTPEPYSLQSDAEKEKCDHGLKGPRKSYPYETSTNFILTFFFAVYHHQWLSLYNFV